MECFHHFTAGLWELFAGNLLLLLCSLFYVAWWVVAFRPDSAGSTPGRSGAPFLAGALLTGLAAVALMSVAIRALSPQPKGVPVRFLLLGGAALYLILLFVTRGVFHRQVTSELLIMLVWAALELSAVNVLYGAGRFGPGCAATMTALVALATAAGLVCYVLYYRLAGVPSYRDGLVPLVTDAGVMAVLLGAMAFS